MIYFTKSFSRSRVNSSRSKNFPSVTILFFLLIFISEVGCKKAGTTPIIHVPYPDKPNIILILADDVGYEIPTCDGGQSYSTPNIDFMATRGMRFTECHSAPLCSPSRFMLLTGKYNFRNYTAWGKMDLSQKTLGNMFRDQGYETAYYGKWQLDGGDLSIRTLGFDNYCVWNPLGPSTKASRYKNPEIYEHGKFLPRALTLNKYGDDIFTDSLLNFIEGNKSHPFFAYYAMCLTHAPFCPTPDDPEFASWDPNTNSDRKFFPSMTKYMDKKIGIIINKVQSLGLENNTLILFMGDNGTAKSIHSHFDNITVEGGKGRTTEYGTRVPLLAYMPGSIDPGTINNDLISFTDFLPTLADAANMPIPSNYGPVDGVSFAPRLTGGAGTPRPWIYCYYDPYPENVSAPTTWVQNTAYKQYGLPKKLFFNLWNDIDETNPLPETSLTPTELDIQQQFLNILSEEHRR